MPEALGHVLQEYGYLAVTLLVFAEGIGVPLPGETALVTAAALAATGRLSIVGVVLSATIGAVLGGTGGYWIGRAGGTALLERHGRWLRATPERLDRARGFFERHGAKTVFLARFVALLRIFAGILAGAAQMPFARYSVYNALGAVVWATAIGALGYGFGRNLPRLEHELGRASLVLAVLVAGVVALSLATRWFIANRGAIAEGTGSIWRRAMQSPPLATLRARHPRAWELIAARFAPGEYLGLHLTVGLVAAAAGLWLFAGITEDVVTGEPLTRFDVALAGWIHAHATPTGYTVASAVSVVGSPAMMAVLAVLIAIVLVRQHRTLVLAGWLAALAGGGVLNVVLKGIVRRPRPPYAAAFLHSHSYSFPSGHAMGSLIGYGMLAYIVVAFWLPRPRERIVVIAIAGTLVLAIGVSRLYLGVHYFSDVVGGYAAGGIWLAASVSGVEIAIRRPASLPPRGGGVMPTAPGDVDAAGRG